LALFVNSWGVVCTLRKGKLPERNPLRTRFQKCVRVSLNRVQCNYFRDKSLQQFFAICYRAAMILVRVSRTMKGTLLELSASPFMLTESSIPIKYLLQFLVAFRSATISLRRYASILAPTLLLYLSIFMAIQVRNSCRPGLPARGPSAAAAQASNATAFPRRRGGLLPAKKDRQVCWVLWPRRHWQSAECLVVPTLVGIPLIATGYRLGSRQTSVQSSTLANPSIPFHQPTNPATRSTGKRVSSFTRHVSMSEG
jgi:hypothetical protein